MKLSSIGLMIAFVSAMTTVVQPASSKGIDIPSASKGIDQQFIYCPTLGTVRTQSGPGINGLQLVLANGSVENQIGVSEYYNSNNQVVTRVVYHLGDVMYINSEAGAVGFQTATGSWIDDCRYL